MKIIEIKIKSFGKLHDFSLKPADGVSIIFGDNESGKSTLMAFIKSMFYGLGNGEKRRQYEPWQGGQMGGSIEFEHDGHQMVLSRSFGATKSGDRISLFDKSIGEAVNLPADKEPGVSIIGMNVKSFVNTVFIGQSGASIEGDNNEILARLTNMASAGDERISKSEIEKNLKKGISSLESKRSDAILPELRKQKHELVEERVRIQDAVRESEQLRAAIVSDTERKASLIKEKNYLDDIADRLKKCSDLKEIDSIIAKNDETADIRERFEKLDVMFSGEKSEQISAFLSEAKELIEAEKSQEIVIENKRSQLEEIKKSADGIDRSRLGNAKIINKYPKEIAAAFERYDTLLTERSEIELEMESNQNDKEEKGDNKLLVFVCVFIVLLSIVLGIVAHPIFFALGIVAIVTVIAYIFIYKKGVNVDGITNEQVALNNVNEDLRALNAEMRHILDMLGVKSMEELDREYKEIERVQNELISAKKRKDNVESEISELTSELEQIRSELREKLSVYREVDSNDEAIDIVNKLDALSNQHKQLNTELTAAQSTLDFMLNGRSYDELVEYGKRLRGDIDLEVDENYTDSAVKGRIEAIEKQLDEVSTRLIQEETKLNLEKYSPQDIDGATDAIKCINRRIEYYEGELDAIETAKAVLDEAFTEMKLDFGPMLNYRAGRLISGITGTKYTSVFVSEKLVPSVAEEGSSDIRNCDVLSTGTYDQVYLSLRLALSGVMSDEKLPVMLDDAFAQFDDDRMERALDFINEDSRLDELGQVLLFTCHSRVLEAAERLQLSESVFKMEELLGEDENNSKPELDLDAFAPKQAESQENSDDTEQ